MNKLIDSNMCITAIPEGGKFALTLIDNDCVGGTVLRNYGGSIVFKVNGNGALMFISNNIIIKAICQNEETENEVMKKLNS